MWHKASQINENSILNYLRRDAVMNTFIIADLENFGLSAQFQDLWYEMTEGKPIGVVLRYYKTLICYSKDSESSFEIISSLLNKYEIDMIQGDMKTVNIVKSALEWDGKTIQLPFMTVRDNTLLEQTQFDVRIALESDAKSIAIKYSDYPSLMALYSDDLEERTQQIANRIHSKEGIHVFIKSDGKIIAHGNTTAENSVSGMIGGLFTVSNDLNTEILSFLSLYLLKNGKQPCLFYSDEAMLPLLLGLGYESIGDWGVLRRT